MGEPVNIERTKRKLQIHIYGCDDIEHCISCEFHGLKDGKSQCSLDLGKTMAEAIDAIDQLKQENEQLIGSADTGNALESAQALSDLLVWLPWAVKGDMKCGELRPKMETIREAADLLRKSRPRGETVVFEEDTGDHCTMCGGAVIKSDNFCARCGRKIVRRENRTGKGQEKAGDGK